MFSLIAAGCGDDGNHTVEKSGDESPPTTALVNDSTTTEAPTTTQPATSSTPRDPEPGNVGAEVGAEVGAANVDELQRFLAVAPEDDGPFYMVNLVRFREAADYADGRVSDLTGREADAIYTDWMRTERLPEIGAEIAYAGSVEDELIAGVSFDQVAVAKYPSRAAFAAMIPDPEFQAMQVHKQAGLADTVVLATTLLPTPSLPVIDAPFPATDEDPPFAFVHVFDYRETAEYEPGDDDADNSRSGADAVSLYSSNAGSVALPLGVRSLAWFDVEAVILGPAGKWDEVRINWFPSHATFDALTSDPVWESGAHHRSAGLEETHAIRTLPLVNNLD